RGHEDVADARSRVSAHRGPALCGTRQSRAFRGRSDRIAGTRRGDRRDYVADHDEHGVSAFREEGTAGAFSQERLPVLCRFRFYELPLLSVYLYGTQHGARFDYLTAGQCIVAVRTAALDDRPSRCGKAYT